MERRYLLGFFPMRLIAGLSGKSPLGRFTNGYTWDDQLSAMLANQYTINELKKNPNYNAADFSDSILCHDRKIDSQIHYGYDLSNASWVQYQGREYVRTYNEGGLTSYDYSGTPTTNLPRAFIRLIVTTLRKKIKKLQKHDIDFKVTPKKKAHTLIVLWSGANDLITVNVRPSIKAVDLAISSNLENLEILIGEGYKNFILCNLPDLSLTPFYKAKKVSEQQNAKMCTDYFNDQLVLMCNNLKNKYPHCHFEIFDANKKFIDVYEHAASYGLNPELRSKAYITFDKFALHKSKPAKGFIFWDRVHPTARIHVLLADEFYNLLISNFTLRNPKTSSKTELMGIFAETYADDLKTDRRRFMGIFKHSHFHPNMKDPDEGLYQVLKHGIYEGGKRTRKVLLELGWINKENQINVLIPALKKVSQRLMDEKLDTIKEHTRSAVTV